MTECGVELGEFERVRTLKEKFAAAKRLLSALAIVCVLSATVSSCSPTPSHETKPQPSHESRFTADRSDWPDPPLIPENFTWSGHYTVADMGIEVPFTWVGANGNFQMVAGGKQHPIHFTNLIYNGELFTLTYEWPDVPRQQCSHVGAFTLAELNEGLAEASYVGRETLHFDEDHEVHHFRSASVLDIPDLIETDSGDRLALRLPIMSGDIYTDVANPQQLRQLLHFGVQNLYDANLDEWIFIHETSDLPGEVILPDECVVGSDSQHG